MGSEVPQFAGLNWAKIGDQGVDLNHSLPTEATAK
jgi:hypothetical protein